MKTSEILIAAKAKIQDPKNWTQRTFARGSDGIQRRPTSGEAVCYCALGAIHSVRIGTTPESRFWLALGAIEWEATRMFGPTASVALINDGFSKVDPWKCHGAVLELFDQAIQTTTDKEYLEETSKVI